MDATDVKVVMITGCSSGIGRALAGAFAAEGLRVAATARTPTSLEGLEGVALKTALDVTDIESIGEAVGKVRTELGPVDILVNNAGFGLMGPLAEVDLEAVRRQMETNVLGVLAVTQAVLPQMIARRSGCVVDIGSVSGVTTTPFAGAYCASKAALHALDDALRMELSPFGIHVISVQPGAIRSRFGDSAASGLERYRDQGSAYAAVADRIEARAGASQEGAMEAAELADVVVKQVLADKPPVRIRAGRHSRMLPFLGLLPVSWRTRIFRKKSGLDRLS